MNLANMITVFRILLIPVYLGFFFSGSDNSILFSGIVFIIAGISDVLDGYIARKYNMMTDLGAVLDPVADKLMIFTVLISFVSKGIIPSWILIALGFKEIVMIIGGGILYLFKGKQVLPSNNYGKFATVTFYVATLSIVFKLPEMLSKVMFILTVFFNIVAFINYFIIYLKIKDGNKAI